MQDATHKDLLDEAESLVGASRRPLEAAYYLLGLLAIKLEAKWKGNGASDVAARVWSRVRSERTFESICAAVEALKEYDSTLELGGMLSDLGLDKEKTLPGGAGGLSAVRPESGDDILGAFVQFADKAGSSANPDTSITKLVDEVLTMAGGRSGKRGGENYTPTHLADLIAAILSPHPESTIYDPAAGTGGLLLIMENHATEDDGSVTPTLYGQEINPQVTALARINMRLHGAESHVVRGDTLVDPAFHSGSSLQTFDHVVANPPIRMNIGSDVQKTLRDDPYGRFEPQSIGRTSDIAFLQHAAASLADDGRGAIIVSPSLLQASGREEKGIKRLLKEDIVEAVIRLPGGMLAQTDIPVSLLILNKEKPPEKKGEVMAVEVSSFEEEGSLSHGQRQRILASVNKHSEIEHFSTVVSRERILDADGVLSPARYVQVEAVSDLIGGLGEKRRLGDVVSIHRGDRLSTSDDGELEFVMAGDIDQEELHVGAPEGKADVEEIDREPSNLTTCKEGDVLLKGTEPFDAAIATEDLEGVPVNQQVFILRLSDEYDQLRRFLPEFFQSDTGHRLLSSFAGGTTIPRLRMTDLPDMPIPVPRSSFLGLIENLHRVEERLETKRDRLSELRHQLFDLKDPDRGEGHVRGLSSSVRALSDSLVQTNNITYRIQNFYPFPIAWLYRSLTTVQESATLREELVRTAENLLGFLGCVGLSVIEHEKGLPEGSDAPGKDWLRGLLQGGVNFGDWQEIAYMTGKYLRKNGNTDLGQDYASIWFEGSSGSNTSSFFQTTRDLASKRNLDKHGGGATPVEREERRNDFQGMVEEAYEAVSFLMKYPLHFVAEIDQPFGSEEFEVTALRYNGDHPAMEVEDGIRLPHPVSKNVLYMESGGDRWIPLHPWIAVTNCPECKRRETFLIDGGNLRESRCKYKGFENGHPLPEGEMYDETLRHLRELLPN